MQIITVMLKKMCIVGEKCTHGFPVKPHFILLCLVQTGNCFNFAWGLLLVVICDPSCVNPPIPP